MADDDDDGLGFRFFAGLAAVIFGLAVLALIGFLLFSRAVYAWGIFGACAVVALILLAFAWVYDRRTARDQMVD